MVALSESSAAILLSVCKWLHNYDNWVSNNLPLNEAERNTVYEQISLAEYELMAAAIGAIIPFVGAVIPGYALLCDGTTYNRVDYPTLYTAIDPAFHIDADTFFVPDMKMKFPLGRRTGQPLGTTGGTARETLTELQIPAHSHDYTTPGTTLVPVGELIPVTLATSPVVPVVTGLTGGGRSHNNMPPSLMVDYIIIAGS